MFLFDILEALLAYGQVQIRFLKEKDTILKVQSRC